MKRGSLEQRVGLTKERTQQSYSRYVSELARYYHRSPELISYQEVADYARSEVEAILNAPRQPRDRVFFIDLAKRAIEFAPGVSVPVKPFWGVIGVAPPRSMGRVPSGPPNVFGGNMDNHDLQPGTSLFLPVHVPGALISIGDGHAVQGDGEVGMSAVETSLKGEIQVVLHKGMRISWPRAETPTHYMTMGLHEDLNQAAKIATREMLNFIVETKGLPRDDAFMLLSAAMDLRVTQTASTTSVTALVK